MRWREERKEVLAMLESLKRRVSKLEASPVPSPGPPSPDPPPPDPSPTRDLALEEAWSSVMNGGPGIQVAIVNPSDPRYNGGPFVVEDNKQGKKGEGATVADAYKAYLTAGGRQAGDPFDLPDFEYEQAEFFCTPSNVQAPTSTRRATDGYYCDYFRSGLTPKGGEKVGPFKSAGEAVQELRRALGEDI